MWNADITNIFSEVVAALSTDPAFNAYVYLAYRNDESGIVGIAYTGSTCTDDDDVQYRTSLNEYQNGDLNTGLVINSLTIFLQIMIMLKSTRNDFFYIKADWELWTLTIALNGL